ncbi:hypothetical protein LJC23_00710 [Desulfovibrio sp. OttesenSCG-928-I05]|nr:hypothetical protein [Desulfovibrio sp. OttesenSCG-928-I05]
MALRIISTSPAFGMVGVIPDMLRENAWELVRAAEFGDPTEAVLPRLDSYLNEIEYLVSGTYPVTREFFAKAPKLKAVFQHGVGVEKIDIAAATEAGVVICNTPGANANAVVELAIGTMISFGRRIIQAHNTIAAGGWERYVGWEIEGRTLGIIGLGTIGKRLALKARALGMRVIANDIKPDHAFAVQHGIEMLDLDAVLAGADVVSLHINGGPANFNFIAARELALLQPDTLFMNFARGDVLDLDALGDVLAARRIAGAVLDVFSVEPPDPVHPVFAHPHCIFTPHNGANSKESQERVGLATLESLSSMLRGEIPERVVNRAVFDSPNKR